MKSYERPVSDVERLFFANPTYSPPNIQIVVEGAGTLDHTRVRHAVAEAGEACPGSRLARAGQTWVDTGIPPEVRVLDGTALPRETLDMLPELNRSLRGVKGEPTCEVLLLTGEPTAIVFRAYHAAMDGTGALTWVDTVFRALRGEQLVDSRSPLTDLQLLREAGIDIDGLAGRTGAAEGTVSSPLNTPASFRKRGTVFVRRTITGVHSCTVAKLAAALTDLCDLDNGRFLVPVDLRRHATGVRSTANLTVHATVDIERGTEWPHVQSALLTALREKQELTHLPKSSVVIPPEGVMRVLGNLVDRYTAKKNMYAGSFFLTHLGRLDIADFSTDSFHATTVYSPPVRGICSPPVISMVEVNGRTEMILTADGGPGMRERAEQLMDGVRDAFCPPAARDWAGNRTDRPVPTPATVTGLFARQVELHPEAVALTDGTREINYRELDERSTAVAAALGSRGIGQGALVGLVAERTVATIAALLGVLKAGAAFLPLEPTYPDARLRGILADAGTAVCLAGDAHRDRDLAPPGCAVLPLEHPAATALPASEVRPDDLAYVIYTSGSTGQPKGVEVEHRNIANYLAWARELYDVTESSRFPLFSSLAFDLAGTALWLPLTSGGSIALVAEEPNHLSLREMLHDRGVNSIKLTPSHLDLITRLDLAPARPRLLVVGGEKFRRSLAADAQRMFGPDCRIFNEYGPTEATIGCTVDRYVETGDGTGDDVPIGRPVGNMRVVLLDPDGCLVPRGKTGEMYLAGAQLARGYRGRPDLDRERFVRLTDGTRAYRTGDLARIDEDDNLDYLGRIDDQVKVLGHRIEPAEVAAALERHPAVGRAVVVARTRTADGATQLIGYVTAETELTASTLREHCAALLPQYMVPSTVMTVDSLPHNPNGKIDIRALPDPFDDQLTVGDSDTWDDITRAVATIWSDTLGVDLDELGVHSDFSSLGGDSIRLLTMLATVSSQVVGEDGEESFMTRLEDIVRSPTLACVTEQAQRALRTTAPTPGPVVV